MVKNLPSPATATEDSGKNAVNVSNDTLPSFFPSWASEGQLLYSMRNNQIWTMQADGSGKRALPDISFFLARLSPDGKRLAYLRQDEPGIVFIQYPSLLPLGALTGAQVKKWLKENP